MKYKQLWKGARLMLLVLISLLVFVPSIFAFEGQEGDQVVIEANEVIEDDLYVGANHFVLEGTVQGDLFVAGSIIEINGLVEGDVIAAGQTIMINGTVTDDVRLAGAAATLGESAQVNDDLIAVGYSLEAKPGSFVGRDLFFGGAQARLAGDVTENVTAYVSDLTLLGTIGGDVQVEIGTAEDVPPVSPFAFMPNAPTIPTVGGGLVIGESASIGGDFDYTTPTSVNVPSGRVAGNISEHIAVAKETAVPVAPTLFSGAWFLEHLRRLVSLFLIGLLLVWLMPMWLMRVSDTVQERLLPSLGWGLVMLVGMITAVILIVTITIILATIFGGVTLGNLAGVIVTVGIFSLITLAVLFGLTVAYGTKIIVSLMSGRFVLGRLNSDWAQSRIGALALGLFLFIILTAIPVLGGWINFIVTLLGLGALFILGQRAYRQRQGSITPKMPPKPTIQPTGA